MSTTAMWLLLAVVVILILFFSVLYKRRFTVHELALTGVMAALSLVAYLFFRIPLFRPDAWLTHWTPRLGWLFSPQAHYLILALGAGTDDAEVIAQFVGRDRVGDFFDHFQAAEHPVQRRHQFVRPLGACF